MGFSCAVKASILFWLSSCVVMLVLFGSLASILLSAFTWGGSSYHCKAINGDKFIMHGAKLPVETFWGIIFTGSVSSLISLVLLGGFMVLLVWMVYKMTVGATAAHWKKKAEQEKQAKQLEECCTPDEAEKLIPVKECPDVEEEDMCQQQLEEPPSPARVQSRAALSDWTQLLICLALECVCFLMIFCFFVSWMFVSRDVAFFSANLSQHYHTARVNLACDAPIMWSVLDLICFLGVCSWFILGMWILGSFLLINRWSNASSKPAAPSKLPPSSPSLL